MVRWQSVRDLPIAGQDVLLEMQSLQLSCDWCGKVFTVHPACVLEGTHVTERLAEALTDCVNVSTLSAAAATYHLPESTVKAVFEKVVERRHAEKLRSLKPITKLGVDEIHLGARDGPRPLPDKPPGSPPPSESPPSAESEKKPAAGDAHEYQLVLVDHTPGQERVIDILPGRSKEELVAWLEENKKNGSLAEVKEVTCDLWEPYREAIREVLGIEPTADRFHVEHQFNDRINQTRHEIRRTHPRARSRP